MKLTMTQRGVITIIGGFFLELVTGTTLLWGSLNVYVTSYYRSKDDPDLKLSLGGAVFPLMMISMALGIPIGMKEIKWFGSARISCMVSASIAAGTVFAASFCTRFWQFIIVYGILHGIAQGTVYFIPIYMGYLYFPKNRGLVAGIVTGGFALCAFTFGLIFFSIVNPTGYQQVKNPDGYSYFEGPSISVAGNVPSSLRYLSLFFIIISLSSSCLILHHPQQIGAEEKRLKEELKKKEKLKNIVQEDIIQIEKQLENNNPNQNNTNQQENKSPIKPSKQQQEEITIEQRRSLHVLTHTLEVVELQEKVLQRKIEVTQHQDEQANFMSFLYGTALENYPTGSKEQFNKNDLNNNQQEQGDARNTSNNTKNNLKQTGESDNINIVRKSLQIQGFNHSRDIIVPSILVRVGGDIDNRQPHKNSCVEQEQMEELLNEEAQNVQLELEEVKKKEKQINELNKMGAPNVNEAFKRPELWVSIFLGILSLGFGMLINGNFKSIAKDYGYRSDSFQVLLGSVGGIANGCCRPIWASLLDKFTFKQILTVILSLEIIFSLTMRFTKNDQVFLVFWIFLIHMCLGAVLGMWPVLSAQLNGVRIGAQLFGLYWFGFGIATLVQFGIVLFWKNSLEFDNIYYIYTGQTVLALIIIRLYDFHVPWHKYYLAQQEKETQKKEIEQQAHTDVPMTNVQSAEIEVAILEIPKKSKEITVHGKDPLAATVKDSVICNEDSNNKKNKHLDFSHAASNQITKETPNHKIIDSNPMNIIPTQGEQEGDQLIEDQQQQLANNLIMANYNNFDNSTPINKDYKTQLVRLGSQVHLINQENKVSSPFTKEQSSESIE